MSHPTERPDPFAQRSGALPSGQQGEGTPGPGTPGPGTPGPGTPEPVFGAWSADASSEPDRRSATRRRGGHGGMVARVLLAAALGTVVALLGSATHRTLWHDLPLGLVIALALTLSTAVLCRAWAGLSTLTAAGLAWLVVVQLISLPGRGGDVIVTDPGAAIPWAWAGVAWSYAGIILFGVVAFLPRRWFAAR